MAQSTNSPPKRRYLTRSRVVGAGLALAVGAAGHFHADAAYLSQLNIGTADTYERHRRYPANPARRTMVLFIDGLRYDVGAGLPAVRQLERRGVVSPLIADFPSFTYPAIATIATGVPPALSGVRINGGGARPQLDSVSTRAMGAGLDVRVADDGFAAFTELLFLPPGVKAVSSNEAFRLGERRSLTWVYFGAVDHAGHTAGAKSAAYTTAAEQADRLIARAIRTLDFAQDVLLVVSDHGHVDRGGHGGVEPDAVRGIFAAAGHGVHAIGTAAPAPMRAVAPTLATLLGAEVPLHAIGDPMEDVLGLPPTPPDPLLATLDKREETQLKAARRRTLLAALALFAGLVALLAAFRTGRVELSLWDFRPALVYALLFWVLYRLAGYDWTWTVPRGYAGFIVETLAYAVAGNIGATWIAKKDRRVPEALASAILFGAPYLLFAAYVGLDRRWMSGPFSSYGIIIVGTAQFYLCLYLGVRALVPRSATSCRRRLLRGAA